MWLGDYTIPIVKELYYIYFQMHYILKSKLYIFRSTSKRQSVQIGKVGSEPKTWHILNIFYKKFGMIVRIIVWQKKKRKKEKPN